MSSSPSENKPPLKSDLVKQKNFYTSLFCADYSDRKLLENLAEKLKDPPHKECVKAQNSSPHSSKYKQLSMSSYCLRSSQCNILPGSGTSKTKVQSNGVKRPNTEKVSRSKKQITDKKLSSSKISKKAKTNPINTKFTKLDGWFCRKDSKSTKNNSVIQNVKGNIKNEKEVLVDNSNKSKTMVKESRKMLKRQSSGSFAKYGMCIPSFEDIVAYQKKFEHDKRCIESLNILEDSQVSLELNIDEPEVPVVILDCKHLSKKEIKDAYKFNSQYVYDIFHGIRYSARHEQFKKQDYKHQFTIKDLKYNTSTTSFTYEQKQQLLTRLHKDFDDEKGAEGLPRNNQYLFKVLLPELCLKIFMDVHAMSCDEAVSYLENTPIIVH